MIQALRVVTDKDASAYVGMAKNFAALNRDLLLVLCRGASGLVSASVLLCKVATRSRGGVYSEIKAAGDFIRTMHCLMENNSFKNLLMNDVTTGSSTAIFSAILNWTHSPDHQLDKEHNFAYDIDRAV